LGIQSIFAETISIGKRYKIKPITTKEKLFVAIFEIEADNSIRSLRKYKKVGSF
jgi:hypothetical protein